MEIWKQFGNFDRFRILIKTNKQYHNYCFKLVYTLQKKILFSHVTFAIANATIKNIKYFTRISQKFTMLGWIIYS